MPWNDADRARYDVILARYSSDMSEAEFALIAPLLPPPRRCGRKPTSPQAILNVLFCMIRCGCLWRYLSKEFPPFTTEWNRFYAWRDSGLWTQIVVVLVMNAREAEGREAAPTAVVVDSQSVKTTEADGHRGFKAGRSRAASATSRSIRSDCPSSAKSRRPARRTAMLSRRCSRPYGFNSLLQDRAGCACGIADPNASSRMNFGYER